MEVAKPGFLNLTLNDSYLLKQANAIACDPHLGVPQAEQPATIVLDYGGPNVAKPLHIGHLRSAIIGESIKRIARAAGHKVIGDIHLGDWGLQIGLVITELQARYPHWRCFAADFDPAADQVEPLQAADSTKCTPLPVKKAKLMKPTLKKPTRPLMSCKMGVPDILLYGKRFCAPLSRI